MRHDNSVFHDVLKRIPWTAFERLVEEHQADKHVRRLSTKSQLIALLYGQLAGATSLREIVGSLQSHGTRLYHLGARPVSRSTFADANGLRPSAVFAELFAQMVARAGRGLKRAVGEAVYLIDGSSLSLAGAGSQWARFSDQACGAKMHVVYDANAERPIYAAVTPANVNDITAAKEMPIEAGATYVFDLGYYDFGWWAKLNAAGCRIVTRLKSHTRLTVSAEQAANADAGILFDRIGLLPQRQAKSRRNPMNRPVREIGVRIETGKVLRIFSNDLTAPAEEIAALYKRRWAIELFFRWVKQTLKIRHFLGNSENAVRIQVAVALIAYLLLQMAKADQATVTSPLAFARLVRTNLMHRKRIDRLLKPRHSPPGNPGQMSLQW
ncbi:transposase IS4 family protein [Rhizobium leguminosarum bv. trifolii WSM2304]|uniref:Transposase IS4 family protein n=1 Tax=Rhizobium leguminosarum bv. trifolii (strain WSM2304) TaxID=395492 RepID=A0ABF7QJ05_RHILW|nr:IS4 family transposase [Rhizobium leguminosarum]ACI53849.1 transposase IS4 family protein [Rhizobium leguminosarum bv. trifolii WSM2304]